MMKSITAKKLMLTSAILACFTSTVSHADWEEETSWDEEPAIESRLDNHESHWGMGSGAVTGAIVGGPAGFLVGAIGGKFIGAHYGMEKTLDERESEVKQLRARLASQQQKLASLEQEKTVLKQERAEYSMQVASLNNKGLVMPPNFESLLQDGIKFNLHFKTDSDQIESHLVEQCRSIGKTLKHFPGLKVRLQGYTDTRGNTDYNLTLAEKRIQAVRALLEESGISSDQIVVDNYGEAGSLQLGNDHDSYAFDRRVVITFMKEGV